MATEQVARPQAAARRVQLPVVDTFLWLVRIAALFAIVWGAYFSISSGRLSGAQWRNLVVFGIAQGSVYGLVALGYTMVYGVLRFINFAHGEVFMCGAMTGYFVSDALASAGLWDSDPVVSLVITLILCMGVSAGIAVLLERVAYRRLRDAPRLIPLITSIGASFFIQYAVGGLFGTDQKAYPGMRILEGHFSILGIPVLRVQTLVIGAAIVMMVGLYLFVERTRAGKAMRAVAEDQETARLMGINVDRTIVLVFAVGGAMAGAAGLLYGLEFGNVNFFSGFLPGIKAFTSAVLGGIGNIVGAMTGGLVLGGVESLGPSAVLEGLGVPASHQLKDVIAFLALVLVLIFRPSGILGERLSEERA
jgi:branched-chain amino acid transport system permease protein